MCFHNIPASSPSFPKRSFIFIDIPASFVHFLRLLRFLSRRSLRRNVYSQDPKNFLGGRTFHTRRLQRGWGAVKRQCVHIDVNKLSFVTVAHHGPQRGGRPAAFGAHHAPEACLVLKHQAHGAALRDCRGQQGCQRFGEFFPLRLGRRIAFRVSRIRRDFPPPVPHQETVHHQGGDFPAQILGQRCPQRGNHQHSRLPSLFHLSKRERQERPAIALTSGLSNLAWKDKSKTRVRLVRWQVCVWRSGKLGCKGQRGAVRSNDWI
jgi:hypothetical protein